MVCPRFTAWLAVVVSCSLLAAQEQDKVESGPKKGAFLPRPFECMHINGPAKPTFVERKGGDGFHIMKQRCLVCNFALSPAVLIFAAEPVEGKDEAFTKLLASLDDLAATFQERNFQVGVVILSPDARDSTNNAKETDADAIIKEAVKREELVKRLLKRTEKLKHVIVGIYPSDGPVVREDPPKGFKLNPKAEMTVLFYERMKIIENFAYGPGTLDAKTVEAMVTRIREGLPLKKKPVEEK